MAKLFKILPFQVLPLQCILVMPQDFNREYLLISNSVISLNQLAFVFYNLESASLSAAPKDSISIYPSGYYEPNIIPANEISVYNPSSVNSISGFILYL